ncbi:hypothetical protein ACFE04_020937 [Oxalis oulophora]
MEVDDGGWSGREDRYRGEEKVSGREEKVGTEGEERQREKVSGRQRVCVREGANSLTGVFVHHWIRMSFTFQQSRTSREEINTTYKIMLRIGFDPDLERKIRARIMRNVIPPGMEFHHIVIVAYMDNETQGNKDYPTSPNPPIWSERLILQNPIELVVPEILRFKAVEPILLLGRHRFAGVNMRIRVKGGGHTSQIYAIRQSIAKALVAFY